jgi:hypothetical protein
VFSEEEEEEEEKEEEEEEEEEEVDEEREDNKEDDEDEEEDEDEAKDEEEDKEDDEIKVEEEEDDKETGAIGSRLFCNESSGSVFFLVIRRIRSRKALISIQTVQEDSKRWQKEKKKGEEERGVRSVEEEKPADNEQAQTKKKQKDFDWYSSGQAETQHGDEFKLLFERQREDRTKQKIEFLAQPIH